MTIPLCKQCDLCIIANAQIAGEGNDKPDIIFIFDYPSHSQNQKGEIFTGKRMNTFIRNLKVNHLYEESYFTHVLKCRPRTTELDEYKYMELVFHKCSNHHFKNEFESKADKAKILVTFGKFAYQFISGRDYIKHDDFRSLCFNIHKLGKFDVLALPHLRQLMEELTLSDAIDTLRKHYARNYNMTILLKHVNN